MFAQTTLLHVLLFQGVLGEDYCYSSMIKGNVQCAPCSEVCPTDTIPCNAKSFCPRQCGKSIAASECTDVCGDNCLDGRCEYIDGIVGLRCIGCKLEYTGKTCNENCAPNCLKCYQNNSTCIKCKGNYSPPDCTETYESTTLPIPFSTANIRLNNCTSENCNKCPNGGYGHNCKKTCTHCNIHLCAKDMSCLMCISNLLSSECVTTWPESKTTTMSGNCTDPDCRQVPGKERYLWLLAAFVLVCAVICGWKYRLSCADDESSERHENLDQDSVGSLPATGYIYIDDNDLEPYYSDLNEDRTRPPRCSPRGLYERIGNQDEYQDVENGSSLSSNSETMFGNLFEVKTECRDRDWCNIAARQLYQAKKGYASADEYEMCTSSYITPELKATRTYANTI